MPGRGYSGDSTRFLGTMGEQRTRLHNWNCGPCCNCGTPKPVTASASRLHRGHIHSQFLAGKLHFLAVMRRIGCESHQPSHGWTCAMAQQTTVRFIDDLDGSDASGTFDFAIDGRKYQIDLSDENAAKLRDALAPYVGAARKAGGRGHP